MKIQHLMALVVLSLATVPGARAAVLAGPLTNAANGHTYYLLSTNTWTASEAEARGLGGHLVTINDAAENQWVQNTFFPWTGDAGLWIGLNDAANEGQFVWASGEPVTFTYWYQGEPNNLGGEDYAAIRRPGEVPPTGSWNDTSGLVHPTAPMFGVVELPPDPTPLPVAVTQPADQFMPGSARLNGQVNPIGSPTLAWFEWGTSLAYGNVTPPQSVGSGNTLAGFSNVLAGLVSGTEYHFRARASNAFGLAAGLDQTFNLNSQRPVVTTLAADQLSTTNARLRGQVNPRGWPTVAWFEWGTDTNYGNVIEMQDVGQGSSVSNLNVVLNGLMSGLNYHYRLAATNVFGAVSGADQTFSLAQVNYEMYDGAAYVTDSPNAAGNIVIASTYNGFPVTRIKFYAFSGCTRLTSVTIPSSVTVIDQQPFVGCTGLTNLSVEADNPVYRSLDGVLFNKAQTTLITYPAARVGGYDIPGSVTRIHQWAFENCTSLTSVTIPNGVTSIGNQAFYYCASLTSVTIPNSVTSLEGEAFRSCTSLTNVIIGDSITILGSSTFSGCANLTSVTIPASITYIVYSAFNGCASLMNLSVDAANPVYSSLNGVLFDKAQTTLIMFPPGRGSYVMPDTVTRIGTGLYAGSAGAFFGCANLTNVIIGNSVTNIGYAAFYGCTNLTRLTIPASVINLGSSAFLSCLRLTNFTFLGNPPQRIFDLNAGFAQFQNVGAGAKAYYYCGTTGWGTTYGGLPTVRLCPPQITPGGFGFTLTRLTNQTVVEASSNLLNWQPIWTNTLPGAAAEFVDPQWLQQPARFYRARSE